MPTKPMDELNRRRQMQALRMLIEAPGTDLYTKRVAYAMEFAVRLVTEPGLVGWPSLVDEAQITARLLREGLKR